jgi:L-ascorbate metabolism protein UlaG (beta-lactamase superfamily)
VLLELGGVRLLTDPVLSSRLLHLRRQGPAPEVPRELDAVLISHMHLDHLHLPSLRSIGRGSPLVVARGAGRFLTRAGFSDVTEIGVGESRAVGEALVSATEALHNGRRRPFGGPAAKPVGFLIEAGGKRVYFAGDTDLFAGMSDLAADLDVALLPVWGWGPSLGPGHLDPASAARAVALLHPRLAVPIHWGTFFPLGQARRRPELLRDPPHDFAARARELAPDVEVRVLEPGGACPL